MANKTNFLEIIKNRTLNVINYWSKEGNEVGPQYCYCHHIKMKIRRQRVAEIERFIFAKDEELFHPNQLVSYN